MTTAPSLAFYCQAFCIGLFLCLGFKVYAAPATSKHPQYYLNRAEMALSRLQQSRVAAKLHHDEHRYQVQQQDNLLSQGMRALKQADGTQQAPWSIYAQCMRGDLLLAHAKASHRTPLPAIRPYARKLLHRQLLQNGLRKQFHARVINQLIPQVLSQVKVSLQQKRKAKVRRSLAYATSAYKACLRMVMPLRHNSQWKTWFAQLQTKLQRHFKPATFGLLPPSSRPSTNTHTAPSTHSSTRPTQRKRHAPRTQRNP